MRLGILGCGAVGEALIRLLLGSADRVRERSNAEFELSGILVRDTKKERKIFKEFPHIRKLITDEPKKVIDSADIVVELIGGLKPAKDFILLALRMRKKVVSANKAVLAQYDDVFEESLRSSSPLFFDAAVGGSIPIVRTLRLSFTDEVKSVTGILNGTSNFILTLMDEKGVSFNDALNTAKKLGYAEADPTLDISGEDAAHKIALLGMLCFSGRVLLEEIVVEGIERITNLDIAFAKDFGYRIKPIAVAKKMDGMVKVAVYPALVPADSTLAKVLGVKNSILIEGERMDLCLEGPGAGGDATATSVLADIIEASKGGKPEKFFSEKLKLMNPKDFRSKFYVRISALDRPGVLAKIASCFGRNNVSIESVIQRGRARNFVPVVIITHACNESSFISAIDAISHLDVVEEKPFFLRIE